MKLGYDNFPVTGVQIVHKIYEAPQNGKMYVRGKGKWIELLEATNSLYYSKQQIDDIINNIVKYDDSYIQEQLKNKVDKDSVYSKEQVNQLLQEIPTYDDSDIIRQLQSKADSSQVYNKEQVDSIIDNIPVYDDSAIIQELNTKVNKDDVYDKQSVQELIDNIPTYDDSSLLEQLENKIDSSQVYNKEQSDDRYVLKGSALENETDPTVPDWAKQETKPVYTANEVGAIPLNMLSELSQMSFVTLDEYESIEKVPNKFYICVEDDELLKIYLGNFLIAVKGDIPTSGFPYTLPIIF